MSPLDSQKKNRLLIIDDDAAVIRLIAEILRDSTDITFAQNGPQGLALAEEHLPDLILLDVTMDYMDGYEVCRYLKQNEVTKQIPIIFITARSDIESEVKCFESGAVDYITKPLNPLVVRARIQVHLKLRHHTTALETLASRDGLTGLFNRRYFDENFEIEFRRLQRHGLPLGLALIDIDHFKKYNDTYGHLAGDDTLRAVAKSLNAITRRPGEFVARYGGEEFVAIMPHLKCDELDTLGQIFCDTVRSLQIEHKSSDCSGIVTISVGIISTIPKSDISPIKLLEQADQALYRAKGNGRNRYEALCS